MNSARTLSENLAALLRHEHDALAEFLVALADFDRRRAWAELGHASLFYYLVRELHLSKGAAQYRKVAAELIQQIPAIVEPLRKGELCLSSIIEAAKAVTPANWEAVLPRFYGLSKREAAEVVAALQPHPAPPTRTVLTATRPTVARETAPAAQAGREQTEAASPPAPSEPGPAVVVRPDEPVAGVSGAVPRAAAPRPTELVPLTADHRRLHMTVSAEFARKLERAKDLRPDLGDEQLLEAALDLFLAKARKQKGLVERPQKNVRPSKDEDHVPAFVRRAVLKRDQRRCQFRLLNGEICGCTHDLQFDHVTPRALGGRSTVDNVRLLCRAHNLEAARRVFGDAVMDRYARKPRRRTAVSPRLRRATAPPTG